MIELLMFWLLCDLEPALVWKLQIIDVQTLET